MADRTAIDVSKVANPYDFANPVKSKERFVGREEELEQILYYLDHARAAERSINLALLGDRAAGKTSLLNIIELESHSRGLIPVRVDLNEGDAESAIKFWYKLFDAIFATLVNTPAADGKGELFGGANGRTYEAYLDLIATYEIPKDKTFCPLEFPLHFARAMGAKNLDALVSEQILRRDLARLSQEARRLIVLLVDECNVLSASKMLLEMVRNTFMNLPGYMLVFTGTPSLFPLMDEVFSPIVRQFKRINVMPFGTPLETLDAVEKPLRQVGLEDLFTAIPSVVRRQIPRERWLQLDEQLRDLHDLTSGKPYEIQLVCHFMFKQVQLGKAKHMGLTHEVLADVLQELGDTRNLSQRPVIASVLRLSVEQLRALRVLVMSASAVGAEETAKAAFITGLCRDSWQEVLETSKEFVALGILSEEGGVVRFVGDDFDRICCKYLAQKERVALGFVEKEPGRMIDEALSAILFQVMDRPRRPVDATSRVMPLVRTHIGSDVSLAVDGTRFLEIARAGGSLPELISQVPHLAERAYHFCLNQNDSLCDGIRVLHLEYESGGYHWLGCYLHAGGAEAKESYESLLDACRQMESRASSVGVRFAAQEATVAGCRVDELLDAVRFGGTAGQRKAVASFHAGEARDAYVEKKLGAAVKHAMYAASMVDGLSATEANNIAYILLASGRDDEARAVLMGYKGHQAFQHLVAYNYGVASLRMKQYEEARHGFERATLVPEVGEIADTMVLLVPNLVDGEVILEERWAADSGRDSGTERLDVQASARAALEIVEQLLRAS